MPILKGFGVFPNQEADRALVFGDSPYTLLQNDAVLRWNTAGGNCVQQLPDIATANEAFRQTLYYICKTSADVNTLTVRPFAGNTIGGIAGDLVITAASTVLIYASSTTLDWVVLVTPFVAASLPISALTGATPEELMFGSALGGVEQDPRWYIDPIAGELHAESDTFIDDILLANDFTFTGLAGDIHTIGGADQRILVEVASWDMDTEFTNLGTSILTSADGDYEARISNAAGILLSQTTFDATYIELFDETIRLQSFGDVEVFSLTMNDTAITLEEETGGVSLALSETGVVGLGDFSFTALDGGGASISLIGGSDRISLDSGNGQEVLVDGGGNSILLTNTLGGGSFLDVGSDYIDMGLNGDAGITINPGLITFEATTGGNEMFIEPGQVTVDVDLSILGNASFGSNILGNIILGDSIPTEIFSGCLAVGFPNTEPLGINEDMALLYAKDIAAGRATLALETEESVAVEAQAAGTHTLTAWLNLAGVMTKFKFLLVAG